MAAGQNERKMEWIKTTDQLPEEFEEVITYSSQIKVGTAYYYWQESEAVWVSSDGVYERLAVTHWMPLPEPPTQ